MQPKRFRLFRRTHFTVEGFFLKKHLTCLCLSVSKERAVTDLKDLTATASLFSLPSYVYVASKNGTPLISHVAFSIVKPGRTSPAKNLSAFLSAFCPAGCQSGMITKVLDVRNKKLRQSPEYTIRSPALFCVFHDIRHRLSEYAVPLSAISAKSDRIPAIPCRMR